MKRGEIYFANLDPAIGAGTKKGRPVLIVSNNANNKVAETITVVPITSNITKVYPFEVMFKLKDSGLSKDSKAQCHQVRTISKMRIQKNRIGRLNCAMMKKIDIALKVHLELW